MDPKKRTLYFTGDDEQMLAEIAELQSALVGESMSLSATIRTALRAYRDAMGNHAALLDAGQKGENDGNH